MPGCFGDCQKQTDVYSYNSCNYSHTCLQSVESCDTLKLKLENISLNNLSEEAKEAKEDIEFEWSDPEDGYRTADFILKNYANIKNLKEHLRNGYRKYEYLALKVIRLKLENEKRFNEANAIYKYYEKF